MKMSVGKNRTRGYRSLCLDIYFSFNIELIIECEVPIVVKNLRDVCNEV